MLMILETLVFVKGVSIMITLYLAQFACEETYEEMRILTTVHFDSSPVGERMAYDYVRRPRLVRRERVFNSHRDYHTAWDCACLGLRYPWWYEWKKGKE